MGAEFLSRFLGKSEIPFNQRYEKFNPKGVIVRGHVPHRRDSVYIDAQVGSLRNGEVKKAKFQIDSASTVTILVPEDTGNLETVIPRSRGHVSMFVGEVEGTFVDTEIWFTGKSSSETILLAVSSRIFLLDDTDDRISSKSILGQNVLSRFGELVLDFPNRGVVLKARNFEGVRAYKKIA